MSTVFHTRRLVEHRYGRPLEDLQRDVAHRRSGDPVLPIVLRRLDRSGRDQRAGPCRPPHPATRPGSSRSGERRPRRPRAAVRRRSRGPGAAGAVRRRGGVGPAGRPPPAGPARRAPAAARRTRPAPDDEDLHGHRPRGRRSVCPGSTATPCAWACATAASTSATAASAGAPASSRRARPAEPRPPPSPSTLTELPPCPPSYSPPTSQIGCRRRAARRGRAVPDSAEVDHLVGADPGPAGRPHAGA